ncbi:CDP-alcohol phosphatidyltransferase family protein [Streptomyces piniterrae]|uniref:CDP-alcohol phosphatidyltransferase family protein n=1 Tax=Streptomyces piniterrae TaxID=2571125 RepID=A0A4U0NW87_9ACTN|nr:CDP-alcohol phosphatidyltransferase family protein [Streptomyces piniterrae]TJZ58880.1 CDP-alcohol phosphatidyltransferase family protein [Streptomyces piniterrae]
MAVQERYGAGRFGRFGLLGPVGPRGRSGPYGGDTAAGAAAQLALLALLHQAVGLGPTGWLTGAVCAVATWAALTHAMRTTPIPYFGPANRVTLARATLVGGVTALVADSFGPAVMPERASVPALIGLATVALVLDAVDGHVARRTGTVTPLGARFDMEVDAFLILVLCVHLAMPLGAWVLSIGAMRYLYVAASWGLPWLRRPLPPSTARKAVAAFQGIVLVVAAAGIVPRVAAVAAVGGALALLVWSFGRDIAWQWRANEPRPTSRRAAPDRRPTP